MIRVASLRSKSLKVFSDKDPDLLSQFHIFKDLVLEAQELDAAFAAWSQSIPEQRNFTIPLYTNESGPDNPGARFETSADSYKRHSYAAIWIHYRAARLIVNSIRMRLLFILAQHGSQGGDISREQVTCQEVINTLATDLCCSISFFLNAHNTTQYDSMSKRLRFGDNHPLAEHEITSKMAVVLSVPLTVAVSTQAVPMAQKRQLQRMLKTVASVMGAEILHSVAENGEFRF